jgi:hypothetical protein
MADKTNIYTKLLAFQKLGVSIRKDKKNPHFKNDYASINEVLDKVKPVLSELGVVIIQQPEVTKATSDLEDTLCPGLRTTLRDVESETEVSGFLPFIGATDPQKLGSNLTYLRRYALVAMLGLEDEDDDGNHASAKTPVAAPKSLITAFDQAMEALGKAETETALVKVWQTLSPTLQKDPEVIAKAKEVKAQILDNE